MRRGCGARPVPARNNRGRAPERGERPARPGGRNLGRDALYRSVRGKASVSAEGGEEGEAGKEGGSSHICKLFLEGNPVPLKLGLGMDCSLHLQTNTVS